MCREHIFWLFLYNNMKKLLEYINTKKIVRSSVLIKKGYFTEEIKKICGENDLTFAELCFRLKHKIPLNKKICCAFCGKKIKFNGKKYATFCSFICSGKYNNDKKIQTCLNTLDENGLNIYQRNKLKSQETCLQEYGVPFFSQTEQYKTSKKETLIKNFGSIKNAYNHIVKKSLKTKSSNIDEKGNNSFERAKEKYKQTMREKYGVDSYTQTDLFRNNFKDKEWVDKRTKKCKETINKKYGSYFNNKEQAKQTKIERYGTTSYNNREQAKKTNLKKYGVEHYNKTQTYKNLFLDKERNEQIQKKIFQTKKKNNTFNTSTLELEFYKLCYLKFVDIKTQYKSDKYPFNCDIYIPSKDLYIELNFHWTHGKEPFNPNNDSHLEILKQWKQKNTKFYNNAIEVWTKRDVKKMKTAKENKLNYLVFYTFEEALKWIEK